MVIHCPCGTKIGSSNDYRLIFLKKNLREIDLLCPNPECYLKELGFVRFQVERENRPQLEIAKFYAPLVTYNATQIGQNEATKELKNHLKAIISKRIDWKQIVSHLEE